jgi:tRNA pseudouridine synthase 10
VVGEVGPLISYPTPLDLTGEVHERFGNLLNPLPVSRSPMELAESPATDVLLFEVTPEILHVAERGFERGLCAECFGRLVGRYGHGLSNPERADLLAVALGRPLPKLVQPCSLCEGAFDRWEVWLNRVTKATEGWEYHRFNCGSRWDPERLAREEALWGEVGTTWGESARSAFNRELGKRVEKIEGAAGVTSRPDLVLLADLPTGLLEMTVLPLYVRGRYLKEDRTLPQTRWPCRRCQGRGCDFCHGTGKTYASSVEEVVAAPFLAASGGEGSRFHGMGREDINARMLGTGRPFVLEILRPRRRTLDLPSLEAEVNRSAAGHVEVHELAWSDGAEVVRIKEATPTKSYRVVILGETSDAKVNEALSFVAGRPIAQRTPTRVAHRRADRVRARRILTARLVASTSGRFTIELRAESGTYIKEWVEGDGGRTDPNLSQLVGAPLTVEALDVLEIHDRTG